jgi:arylsulfatase A-like enzyme
MLNWARKIRSIRSVVLFPLGAVVCLVVFWTIVRSDIPQRKSPSTPTTAARSDLNLLVVTLDTTRADVIGTYGGRAITPTIDQLAATGVVFDQASTVAPLTLPAHSSLFTALFPPRHQVHENGEPLGSKVVTLAERLSAAGFATGAFVGSFVLDRRWGLNRGFAVYRDVETHQAPVEESSRRSGDRVVDDALGWLQGVRDRRFFAWLHFYDAHAPAAPPSEFASPNGQDSYAGAVGFIDFQLSRVMNFLGERGLLDRTVVVIVGDHGESLGEHGEVSHGLFVYQSVIHVPLIIHAPLAFVRAGRIVDPVRIVDVMPTVLDLLGQPPQPAVEGRTLLPLMNGSAKTLALEAYSESRYGFDRFGWSALVALRRGDFKLIVAPRPELYDLASDPLELNNLYGQRAALVTALTERLQEIDRPADAAARARLSALGYVSAPAVRAPDAGEPLADPKDKIELYRQLTDHLHRQGVLP